MSQKSGKRLRKRQDDETETSTKTSPPAEINKSSEEESLGNGVAEENKTVEKEIVVEVEVNGTHEKEVTQKEIVTTEETIEKIVTVEETKNDKSTDKEQNQNKTTHEETVCTKVEKIEKIETKIETENELEPLILETEEVDPELQFDENSDIDSQKSSPVRCTTRRSQTRNVPTPKTPKIFDSISDDKASECSDKPSIFTAPTPEITDTESEISVFKPVTDIYDTNEELTRKTEELDSFPNISTKAIVGSDTTRNADLSACNDDEFEMSPFLIQSREKTVGESLKLLSSRRSIRTAYTIQSNAKKAYKTPMPFTQRETVDNVTSGKRKNRDDSPDYSKRFKTTESPGLFSYISSPIANIKNRFNNKSEIPSSTPKLTGYKSKNMFDNTNVSKISLNETEEVAEKKWCTIM